MYTASHPPRLLFTTNMNWKQFLLSFVCVFRFLEQGRDIELKKQQFSSIYFFSFLISMFLVNMFSPPPALSFSPILPPPLTLLLSLPTLSSFFLLLLPSSSFSELELYVQWSEKSWPKWHMMHCERVLVTAHEMPVTPNSLSGGIPKFFYSLLEVYFPIGTMLYMVIQFSTWLPKPIYSRIWVSYSTSHTGLSSESSVLGPSSPGAGDGGDRSELCLMHPTTSL